MFIENNKESAGQLQNIIDLIKNFSIEDKKNLYVYLKDEIGKVEKEEKSKLYPPEDSLDEDEKKNLYPSVKVLENKIKSGKRRFVY